MTLQETMRKLESMGTEQNRKVFKRHGAGDNLYGVSFANLEKLRKQIQTDHKLAQQLWATGNTDARTLATMIASPAEATEKLLDEWVSSTDYYCLIDVFARNLAGKTPLARKKMDEWTRSKDEWIGRAGWHLLGGLAMNANGLPDSFFEPYLKKIEGAVHSAPNRTRDAMMGAVIAIGMRSDALEKKALASAKRIGKVEVDHGETGCKTPDAVAYIQKARARLRARGK